MLVRLSETTPLIAGTDKPVLPYPAGVCPERNRSRELAEEALGAHGWLENKGGRGGDERTQFLFVWVQTV